MLALTRNHRRVYKRRGSDATFPVPTLSTPQWVVYLKHRKHEIVRPIMIPNSELLKLKRMQMQLFIQFQTHNLYLAVVGLSTVVTEEDEDGVFPHTRAF